LKHPFSLLFAGNDFNLQFRCRFDGGIKSSGFTGPRGAGAMTERTGAWWRAVRAKSATALAEWAIGSICSRRVS